MADKFKNQIIKFTIDKSYSTPQVIRAPHPYTFLSAKLNDECDYLPSTIDLYFLTKSNSNPTDITSFQIHLLSSEQYTDFSACDFLCSLVDYNDNIIHLFKEFVNDF